MPIDFLVSDFLAYDHSQLKQREERATADAFTFYW